MDMTRLGQGVDEHGALRSDAMERTLKALGAFAESCRRHGVANLRITATSAARDASNRDVFFEAVRRELGQAPELLAGEAEAELSFSGATRSLRREQLPCVVCDIGGGSTELSSGAERPTVSVSLDLGSVRITERFLHHDPPLAAELEMARAFARDSLQRASEVALGEVKTWVGVAGTVTTIAAIALGLDSYDRSRTQGYALTKDQAASIVAELAAVNLAERRGRLLQPQRADIIVGGGIIVQALFDIFGVEQLLVSESDILDGLAASLL